MNLGSEQAGISIIIPVYNDRKGLKNCLESFSALEPQLPYEIIVVDNNSTEPIKDIVDQCNYTYCIEEKKGSYAARNTGVRRSRYKYLCFTDADCVFDKNWFKALLPLIEKDKPFYYAGNIEVTTGKNPSCIEWYEQCFAFDQEKNVKKQISVTAHLLIDRQYFNEFGGFNEEYLSGGDAYFTMEVSKKYKLKFARDLLVYHPSRSLTELIKKDIRVVGGKYINKVRGRNFFYKQLYPFGYSLKQLLNIPKKTRNKRRKICLISVICLGILVKFFTLVFLNFGLTKPQRK